MGGRGLFLKWWMNGEIGEMGNKLGVGKLVPKPTNCDRENEDREQGR